jgi:hypothetical protein
MRMTGRIGEMAGFGIVASLPAGSNFLMTLVLVRTLTVQDFAAWSVIEPAFLIFSTLAGLGLQFGLLFVTASKAASSKEALGTALTAASPVALIAGSVVWFVLASQLPGVRYATLTFALVAEALALLTIANMRGQRLISRWVMFECLRSTGPVAVIGGCYLFTPLRIDTVDSLLLLRGSFTAVGVAAVAVSQGVRPGIDGALLMRMLRYGFPIALASGVTVTVSGADRFLLALLDQPAAEIANYAAHQRLAGLLTVAVVTPLNMWFAVEAIRRDTTEDAAFFRRVLIAVVAMLSIMTCAAFIVGPLIWPFLFPAFTFRPLVYALLAGAVVPQALGIVTNIGALREKSTHVSTIVAATSGTVMLTVGLALVGTLGGVGAAAARFAALTSTAVVGRTISQRIAPVAHRLAPLSPFALALALALAMLFAPEWELPSWPLALASLAAWCSGVLTNRAALKSLAVRS